MIFIVTRIVENEGNIVTLDYYKSVIYTCELCICWSYYRQFRKKIIIFLNKQQEGKTQLHNYQQHMEDGMS